MGYIKEPIGIDFVVDPTPLTETDKKRISEVISYYKETGKKLFSQKTTTRINATKKTKNKILA
jgi:hypothetical protein